VHKLFPGLLLALFVIARPLAAAELSMVLFNVESDHSERRTLGDQVARYYRDHRVDVWGFAEVWDEDWVRQFTRDDPGRAQQAREYGRATERAFAFGGGRTIAREERREAGFTEEELEELEELVQVGPRRETLVRAAEILRDRHRARARGEVVPPAGPADA